MKGKAIWRKYKPRLGDRSKGEPFWVKEYEEIEVRILATAEGYALARQKGCGAIAIPLKDLRDTENGQGL